MTRILTLLLVLALVFPIFTLIGCGGDDSGTGEAGGTNEVAPEMPTSSAEGGGSTKPPPLGPPPP